MYDAAGEPVFVFNFPVSEDLLARLAEDANGKRWLINKLRSLLFLNYTLKEVVDGTYHILGSALEYLVQQPRSEWSLADFQAELENSLLSTRESFVSHRVYGNDAVARFSAKNLYLLSVFFSTWITSNSKDVMLLCGYLTCTPTKVKYVAYKI
jgi:hypothetical protein